eukprot:15237669-Alexandrium_andersonii.AAC.1
MFGSPAQGLTGSVSPAPKQRPTQLRPSQGPSGSAGRAPLQSPAKPVQPRKQQQQQPARGPAGS